MLSNLDDQRAVWLQIRAFYGGGSRGQREEGDSSQNPPRVTEAEGESYLEPAAGPDQEPGAVVVAVTSDQWVAPSHLGEAGQSNPGTGRVASVESGTGAVAPGVPPGAAQGGLEPKGGGDLLGGPPLGRGEGQPSAREARAPAPPRVAPESGGEREQVDLPPVEELPGKGGSCSPGGAARREGAQQGHAPGRWEKSAGKRPAVEPPAQERGEPSRRGGECRCGRNRGRKTRRAGGLTARPTWEWILLELGL